MWHCICPEFLLLALISGSLSFAFTMLVFANARRRFISGIPTPAFVSMTEKEKHGGTTNAVLWSCWRGNRRSGTRRVYGMDEHFLWHQQS